MIELNNLTKSYGTVKAITDIYFKFEPGKIYGFLGPNGAGKSTTMNIITGCLSASEGTVLINGYDIISQPSKAKKHVGYLPEIPPLYSEMTPYEYLLFVAEAKKISAGRRTAEIERVMQCTDITDVKDRLISNLSKGCKQRVGIAQALIGQPEYIILDEPTVGLDPNQIIEIRELIRSLRADHTVIISSHILSEISTVCDEILVICDGRLVANGTEDELRNIFSAGKVLSFTLKTDNADIITEQLCDIDDVLTVASKESAEEFCTDFEVSTQESDLRERVFLLATQLNAPIMEMHLNKPSLEEIFINLTRRSKEEENEVDLQA